MVIAAPSPRRCSPIFATCSGMSVVSWSPASTASLRPNTCLRTNGKPPARSGSRLLLAPPDSLDAALDSHRGHVGVTPDDHGRPRTGDPRLGRSPDRRGRPRAERRQLRACECAGGHLDRTLRGQGAPRRRPGSLRGRGCPRRGAARPRDDRRRARRSRPVRSGGDRRLPHRARRNCRQVGAGRERGAGGLDRRRAGRRDVEGDPPLAAPRRRQRSTRCRW